jgi:hypothetical protein
LSSVRATGATLASSDGELHIREPR